MEPSKGHWQTYPAAQDFLGVDRQYYHPVDRGFEAELAHRLEEIRNTLSRSRPDDADETP